MPGWMGLRGLAKKSVHDMERERREDQHLSNSEEIQRRSDEKVQEVLRAQQGDMSAFTGSGEDGLDDSDADICLQPLKKIMSSKVAVLSFDDSLLTVQGIFAAVKFRHLPVVDDGGGIIGIVSDRDILRMASPFFGTVNEQTRDKEIMTRKIGTIMTRQPVCGRPETSVRDAVKMMNDRKISCLPVIESFESKLLLGIITWKDIVRAFCPDVFDRASDSRRLRSGVTVMMKAEDKADRGESSDTTRIFPSPQEAAPDAALPPKPRLSYEEEASMALASRPSN